MKFPQLERLPETGLTADEELDLIRSLRRRFPPGKLPKKPRKPHGTRAAYQRHLRRGETPCYECQVAIRHDRRKAYDAGNARHTAWQDGRHHAPTHARAGMDRATAFDNAEAADDRLRAAYWKGVASALAG